MISGDGSFPLKVVEEIFDFVHAEHVTAYGASAR
jgi:hypothetical protein